MFTLEPSSSVPLLVLFSIFGCHLITALVLWVVDRSIVFVLLDLRLEVACNLTLYGVSSLFFLSIYSHAVLLHGLKKSIIWSSG